MWNWQYILSYSRFPSFTCWFLHFQQKPTYEEEKQKKERKGGLHSRFFRAKCRESLIHKDAPVEICSFCTIAPERCSNVVKSRAALRILRSPAKLSGRSSKRRCTPLPPSPYRCTVPAMIRSYTQNVTSVKHHQLSRPSTSALEIFTKKWSQFLASFRKIGRLNYKNYVA